MKNIIKLLTIAVVLTTASQSFGMLSRFARLTTKRAPAQRALVRTALRPAVAAKPRIATAAKPQLKTIAPVASVQVRRFSNSAPVRIQKLGEQEQESQGNRNSFKSAHARFALGGLAALTSAGIALYSEPAKAEGADDSDERIRTIKAMQDKKDKEIKAVIDTHQIRMEYRHRVFFDSSYGLCRELSSFIESNYEIFLEVLKLESSIEDKSKQKDEWNKCADFFAKLLAEIMTEDEFIKNYPGYNTGALNRLIGLSLADKNFTYSRGKDCGKRVERGGVVAFYIEVSKSSIFPLNESNMEVIQGLRNKPLAQEEARLVDNNSWNNGDPIEFLNGRIGKAYASNQSFVEKKK